MSGFAYYSAAVGHLVRLLALCPLVFTDLYVIPSSLCVKHFVGTLWTQVPYAPKTFYCV